tara:strand:+ start:2159 stop:3172 length:1014 start_codon:yes stop_codon:yes gene_type:complete
MTIKNLIFSGSGSKIFIYLGVIKYLLEQDKLKDVTNYVGTSGGTLIALLLVLNYDYDSIHDLFIKINLETLQKIDSVDVLNFFDNYGINDLNECERILRIILKAKLGVRTITFKELYKITNKNLVICATNIHKYKTVFFSHIDYPDMDVITAITMSICIPFFFKPIKYKNEFYVDGSITCHYPIEYFKEPEDLKHTLGILIVPDYYICQDEAHTSTFNCIKRAKINTVEDYIFTVLGCPIFKTIQDVYNKYKKNTILIINNFNGLNFDISNEEKKNFLEEGYTITKKCFDENVIMNDSTKLVTELMTKKEPKNNKKTKKKPTTDSKPKYVSVGIQTE